MEKVAVALARTAAAVGREVQLQGWVRTRRDSKGGFSFLEINDGSCFGNVQVIADGSLAELRERDQTAWRRLQPDRRRPCEGVAGQRAADRSAGHARRSCTAGRCRDLSAAKEAAFV